MLADYVASRVKRGVMPDQVTKAHEAVSELADPLTDQVKRLRSLTESLLREHKKGIIERQFHQKRLADAVADIYAQIATLSRVTAHLGDHDVEVSGQELYIAETFCTRAAERAAPPRPDRRERRRPDGLDSQARPGRASTATPSSMTSAQKRLVLIACILGTSVVTVDATVVNVALPAIEEDLGGGLAGQQWTSNAYLVTLGSLLLIGGSLGDVFGERRCSARWVSPASAPPRCCARSRPRSRCWSSAVPSRASPGLCSRPRRWP